MQQSSLSCAQADRRALNITLNSIGTELTRDDRRKLYSNFGLLYPHGHHELASAEDFDQIRNAMEKCPPYQALFNKLGYGESQMLDKVRRLPMWRSSHSLGSTLTDDDRSEHATYSELALVVCPPISASQEENQHLHQALCT